MTKSTIKFTKENLQRLKASSKPKWHYAENFEGLALYAGKQKKTYYAHWSKPFTDKSTGKIKFIGKRKRIGGFHIPLDEIKEKVRKNLDEWKKTAAAADGGLTIGGLVKQFLDHGSTGYRVKTKGAYEEIYGLIVTKNYYYSKSPKIWIEDKIDYPHRYGFRKKVLFEGKDIPCTINHLGRSLHEMLRKAQISSSIEKIDSSMIVKLMSLCRK